MKAKAYHYHEKWFMRQPCMGFVCTHIWDRGGSQGKELVGAHRVLFSVSLQVLTRCCSWWVLVCSTQCRVFLAWNWHPPSFPTILPLNWERAAVLLTMWSHWLVGKCTNYPKVVQSAPPLRLSCLTSTSLDTWRRRKLRKEVSGSRASGKTQCRRKSWAGSRSRRGLLKGGWVAAVGGREPRWYRSKEGSGLSTYTLVHDCQFCIACKIAYINFEEMALNVIF